MISTLVFSTLPSLVRLPRIARALRTLPAASAVAALLAAAGLAGAAHAQPAPRATGSTASAAKPAAAGFDAFLRDLWRDAQARGVSRATFDAAMSGVTPNPRILALTKKQAEFVRPIWSYLDGAVAGSRIEQGRRLAAANGQLLDRIERSYGVPRGVVLAVWGIETSYGAATGGEDVIRSLATLAHARFRDDFFRNELLTALTILERGDIAPRAMKGSWAGAMGHTQFMPSSYEKWAVDGDGDGRRDIWNSVPDALASTANYLKEHGWNGRFSWGYEVKIPEGFRFGDRTRAMEAWARAGLARVDGERLPVGVQGTLFLPAGHKGPAFLLTSNFETIKAYNTSESYALAVGHLGDRIGGGDAIAGAWPRGERILTLAEGSDLQRRLKAKGLFEGKIDGKLGAASREGVRLYQAREGLIPDGYATPELLARIRGGG